MKGHARHIQLALNAVRGPSEHLDQGSASPLVSEALLSSAQPLEPETRACMEERFGHGFSRVRVHADASAAAAARALQARAFTTNGSIVFDAGEYEPQGDAGRRLLSHELAHVVQQRAGVHLGTGVSRAVDAHERQADAADAVAEGRSVGSVLAPSRVIARPDGVASRVVRSPRVRDFPGHPPTSPCSEQRSVGVSW